jgi:hypothetical protein
MTSEAQTQTITISTEAPRHLSLAAACVGFLGSTFGLTIVMVLLGHV